MWQPDVNFAHHQISTTTTTVQAPDVISVEVDGGPGARSVTHFTRSARRRLTPVECGVW